MLKVVLFCLFFGFIEAQTRDPSRMTSDAAFCRFCIEFRNGIGYYEDPNDCSQYFQCDMDDFGNPVAHIKKCASGSLWDFGIGTCVDCATAACTNSIIVGSRCPETPPHTTQVPVATTLPEFGDTCRVSSDSIWTHFAVIENGNIDNSVYYRQADGFDTFQRIECGAGNAFNLQDCRCMRTQAPSMLADYPFDRRPFRSRVGNYWTDCRGVRLDDGLFNSNSSFFNLSHCEIPRFANYDFESQFTVSFFFRNQRQSGTKIGLVSNGECRQQPSIEVNLVGTELRLNVRFDNNGTEQAQSLSAAGLATGSWNFFAMTFDGDRIRMFVNSNSPIEVEQKGRIMRSLAALVLGRNIYCDRTQNLNSNFFGNMENFKMYAESLTVAKVEQLRNGQNVAATRYPHQSQ